MAQAIGACTVSRLVAALGRVRPRGLSTTSRTPCAAAVANGADAEARRRLACASLTAGLAMNLSDCAADHALGQAIGSVKHLPHGLTVGLVLAETLDVSRVDCADRLERVADALGEPGDGTADGSRAVRAVRRMLADVGFPTLREAGVVEDDLPALVQAATTEQAFFLDIDCHDWRPPRSSGLPRGARPRRTVVGHSGGVARWEGRWLQPRPSGPGRGCVWEGRGFSLAPSRRQRCRPGSRPRGRPRGGRRESSRRPRPPVRATTVRHR